MKVHLHRFNIFCVFVCICVFLCCFVHMHTVAQNTQLTHILFVWEILCKITGREKIPANYYPPWLNYRLLETFLLCFYHIKDESS